MRMLAGGVVGAVALSCGIVLAPQAAFAASNFSPSVLYATVANSSEIVSIDRATGATTGVLTVPGNATGLNQLGFSGSGDKLFVTNATNVYEYTAGTEQWETTPRDAPAPVAVTMGGASPNSGKFFFGGQSAGATFTFASYDPTTNDIGTNAITVTAADAPGGNGDLAFDRNGNLYFVASSAANAQIYRVDAAALSGTTATATKVGPAITTSVAFNSMAFGDDGYMYVSGAGTNGFRKINPVTGATVETHTAGASLTDMGSNAVPATGSATTSVPVRHDVDDQFAVSVSGGGIPTPVTASTTGVDTSATAGPLLVMPGQTYTVTQTPSATTNPAHYDTTWQCIDQNGTVVNSGTGSTAQFTVPAGGGDVSCSFTNTLKNPGAAVDDASTGNTLGSPATVTVLGNDTGDLVAGTVKLVAPAVAGSTVSPDGKSLTVPGQGPASYTHLTLPPTPSV